MEAIKFTLYGYTAHFRISNNNGGGYYMTYPHIHKPSLLGLIGAKLGLKGYGSISNYNELPEYYKKLSNLKISIVPNKSIFDKFIEITNNTTGLTSKEGNQIIKNELLINPEWDIYIMSDNEMYEDIKLSLLKKQEIYQPYFGSGKNIAYTKEVEVINLNKLDNDDIEYVDSLYLEDILTLDDYVKTNTHEISYNYSFIMPYRINSINDREMKAYNWSNRCVDKILNNDNIYGWKDKILYFM